MHVPAAVAEGLDLRGDEGVHVELGDLRKDRGLFVVVDRSELRSVDEAEAPRALKVGAHDRPDVLRRIRGLIHRNRDGNLIGAHARDVHAKRRPRGKRRERGKGGRRAEHRAAGEKSRRNGHEEKSLLDLRTCADGNSARRRRFLRISAQSIE